MARIIYLLIINILLSIASYSIPIDSCKIILEGFKKTDGFIIFRNSQDVEGGLTPFSLTGQKERKLFIPCPVMFYSADVKCAPFFLMPDDILIITKVQNDYRFRFVNNQIRTNEQNLLWKIYKDLGPIYGSLSTENQISSNTIRKDALLNTKSDSEAAYIVRNALLKNLSEKKLALIKEFKNSNFISTYFENYLKKYVRYIYLISTLKGLTYSNIPAGLKKEINQSKIEDEQDSTLLQIDSYRGFLNSFDYLLKGYPNCQSSICRLQEITQNFNYAARDYLLFQEIKKHLNQIDTTTRAAIEYFKENCKNEIYIKIVENEFKLSYQVVDNSNRDFIVDQNLTDYDLAKYLNERKTKIIILDFWASWCEPCMRELLLFKELVSKYSNNKNLIFLFISMDKSANDWLRASERFEFMNKQNNYFLRNNFKAGFSKKYSINTIPRGMIIGINNIIISKEAPEPNNKALEKLIDKIIRNKITNKE